MLFLADQGHLAQWWHEKQPLADSVLGMCECITNSTFLGQFPALSMDLLKFYFTCLNTIFAYRIHLHFMVRLLQLRKLLIYSLYPIPTIFLVLHASCGWPLLPTVTLPQFCNPCMHNMAGQSSWPSISFNSSPTLGFSFGFFSYGSKHTSLHWHVWCADTLSHSWMQEFSFFVSRFVGAFWFNAVTQMVLNPCASVL